jgi:hypothetical protein
VQDGSGYLHGQPSGWGRTDVLLLTAATMAPVYPPHMLAGNLQSCGGDSASLAGSTPEGGLVERHRDAGALSVGSGTEWILASPPVPCHVRGKARKQHLREQAMREAARLSLIQCVERLEAKFSPPLVGENSPRPTALSCSGGECVQSPGGNPKRRDETAQQERARKRERRRTERAQARDETRAKVGEEALALGALTLPPRVVQGPNGSHVWREPLFAKLGDTAKGWEELTRGEPKRVRTKLELNLIDRMTLATEGYAHMLTLSILE